MSTWKCFFFSMNEVLAVGEVTHAWGLRCGRCSTLPYLLAMNFIRPWYICLMDHESLSIRLVVHSLLWHIWGGRSMF